MESLVVAGGVEAMSRVAMGSKAQPPVNALVLGKCLRGYWSTHAHVKGCPPSGHAVAKALVTEEAKP